MQSVLHPVVADIGLGLEGPTGSKHVSISLGVRAAAHARSQIQQLLVENGWHKLLSSVTPLHTNLARHLVGQVATSERVRFYATDYQLISRMSHEELGQFSGARPAKFHAGSSPKRSMHTHCIVGLLNLSHFLDI